MKNELKYQFIEEIADMMYDLAMTSLRKEVMLGEKFDDLQDEPSYWLSNFSYSLHVQAMKMRKEMMDTSDLMMKLFKVDMTELEELAGMEAGAIAEGLEKLKELDIIEQTKTLIDGLKLVWYCGEEAKAFYSLFEQQFASRYF